MTDNDLDETFEAEAEETTEVEETETPTEEVTGETEQSTESSNEESTEEAEATPPVEPTSVPIAALHDERRKAQALKEEVEQLRGMLPQTEEAPDPNDDPEGYESFVRLKVETELYAKSEQEKTEFIQKSRETMLEKHEDFADMEQIFLMMAAQDRSLINEMRAHQDPAQFTFNTARKYKESLLGGEPEAKPSEPSEKDKRNKSAVEAPNLATATAQASNGTIPEKEETLDTMFEDQAY